MSLMALNHWKRQRQNTFFTDAERNDKENQQKEVFACTIIFGSGLDDAVNGGTSLLLEGSLQTNIENARK